MSGWRIEYESKAFADLKEIDRPIRRQIIDRLEWLVDNFDDVTPSALHDTWKGFYKYRIGDWRVVYSFNTQEQLIRVRHIDRRDKVYKRG